MNILLTAGKWMKRAVVLKLGRSAIKKGGAFGIGAGVILGFAYLTHNFINNREKRNLRRIDDIEDNNPEIEGTKKIVV